MDLPAAPARPGDQRPRATILGTDPFRRRSRRRPPGARAEGRFTPEEALRQLLRDSGLKAQARDEHTFIVVPASEAAVPATQARV